MSDYSFLYCIYMQLHVYTLLYIIGKAQMLRTNFIKQYFTLRNSMLYGV